MVVWLDGCREGEGEKRRRHKKRVMDATSLWAIRNEWSPHLYHLMRERRRDERERKARQPFPPRGGVLKGKSTVPYYGSCSSDKIKSLEALGDIMLCPWVNHKGDSWCKSGGTHISICLLLYRFNLFMSAHNYRHPYKTTRMLLLVYIWKSVGGPSAIYPILQPLLYATILSIPLWLLNRDLSSNLVP